MKRNQKYYIIAAIIIILLLTKFVNSLHYDTVKHIGNENNNEISRMVELEEELNEE